MTNKIYGWFLKWLMGPADIVDGVCWIVTFACWRPDLGLRAADAWLDWEGECKTND